MVLIIPKDQTEDRTCKQHNVVDWRNDTLVEMVRHRACSSPSMVIYTLLNDQCDPVDTLTAIQLDHQASVIAAGLHHFGKEKNRVLILCENDLNYVLAFFGCIYANMIPVSGIHVDVIRSDERFATVLNDAQPDFVIGPRHLLIEYKDYFRKLDCNPVWIPLEVLLNVRDKLVKKGDNKDVALIQYSSGTTRNTKGILITHRNLMYNVRHQPASEKILESECNGLSWLPFAHDMGLIGGIIVPVGLGRKIFLLPPKYFIEKPVRWLQAITRYKIQVSGGPTFAYNLCLRETTENEIRKLDLSSWQIAVNGADNSQAETIEKFCKRFSSAGFRARHFIFGYGLAEATLTVTNSKANVSPKFRNFSRKALMTGFVRQASDVNDQRILVSCGYSLEDQKIVIVNPENDQILRDGRVGEICVSGPSVARGYFNRPEETEDVFHSKLSGSKEFYLRTGDLGFIYENELYFAGRISNVITLGNKKYDPGDISCTLENSCPDIRINGTTFFLENLKDPTSITILAETIRNPVKSYEEIVGYIYEKVTKLYMIWPRTIVLTRPGGVLKTPSGKIQIARTREAFCEKKLPVIKEFRYQVPIITAFLSFKEAYNQVEEWIGNVTKDWKGNVKQLTRNKLLNKEVNHDLLLDLRYKFEEKFHVEIDPSDFMTACQTYTDLCHLLAKQICNSEL